MIHSFGLEYRFGAKGLQKKSGILPFYTFRERAGRQQKR